MDDASAGGWGLKCVRCDGVVIERKGRYRHKRWWLTRTCGAPVVVTDWGDGRN
ncbi:MAG TPA: hypothetical protein VNT50_10145 [Microbacterium sp.]|uniref:hypothetical protein n=1 Tax=Microbacterium sp. TaxID=51671 RepID=UPI002B863240|nr:hypothetical protein [Microbacterium sp.]HWI31842.1 hypothetical protein [Microbacterium sp.]